MDSSIVYALNMFVMKVSRRRTSTCYPNTLPGKVSLTQRTSGFPCLALPITADDDATVLVPLQLNNTDQ